MIVMIKDGVGKTKDFKNALKKAGFKWKATGKYSGNWSKNVPDKDLEKTQHWCEVHKLRFIPEDEHYSRTVNYRDAYFESHKPAFGKYYHCAYCGKPLVRDKVTVDHIYPIAAVKEPKNKLNRWIMHKVFRIKNINDPKNLTASCGKCNSKKGNKCGFWTFRGLLGQYWIVWFIGVVLATIVAFIAIREYLNFFFLR